MNSKGGCNETTAWVIRFKFIVQFQNRLFPGLQHYVTEMKCVSEHTKQQGHGNEKTCNAPCLDRIITIAIVFNDFGLT